jgi:DNA-directed RNA polymerase subunit RPC12/RpoP
MIYDDKCYVLPGALCPRCGRSIAGELSIPNPKELDYQKEWFACLECGYEYFRQKKQLSLKDVAKHKSQLDFISTSAQCPKCKAKMDFRSDKREYPSHKYSWGYGLEYVCFACGFWLSESVAELTLEEINQRRSHENLLPLPRF